MQKDPIHLITTTIDNTTYIPKNNSDKADKGLTPIYTLITQMNLLMNTFKDNMNFTDE